MTSKSSLQNLLNILVNTPEAEKGALVYAILKSLREACNMFDQSALKEKQAAKELRDGLDKMLSANASLDADEEWEEEFADSSMDVNLDDEKSTTFVSSESKISIPEEDLDTPRGKIRANINNWNRTNAAWLKLPNIDPNKSDQVVHFVKAVAAIRANIKCNPGDSTEYIEKLDNFWSTAKDLFAQIDYFITSEFGTISDPIGEIIYTCRNRITERTAELLCPGIDYKGETLLKPTCLCILPVDAEYPMGHVNQDLASHWRGIFGEIDLLIKHVQMQRDVSAAIEGVNKNKVESIRDSRSAVLAELKRRADVLRATINKKDETIYRLATDYWRVEECFWSIFHDDDRPSGYSYFDRLRNRIQAWRTTLRRIVKFNIRDFSCGSDTLASVNKYIGNMILSPQKNIAPGTVIRELRPAIIVNVQSTSRMLKGRVIAT
ncbi:hypothetical protein [Candidatus Uabimicrobium sp. HlEnr_7]|uniref:hypothetical protein n=1 Tax=Candidatus Uabimicrobium helgolandensis TaxID=3095367 RepID=UPI0035587FF9